MELLDHLGLGFATALSPWNLLYAFVGCLLGTAVGVLPGLGPLATIAMLLPLTFSLPPVSALIMLSGIYYGAQYGGSTTAILINLPGRVLLGGDRDRRLPDGQAGPRRAGAGDRGPGLVLRRHGGDRDPGPVRAAARQRGARVRPGRIFLADGAGPGGLGGPGLGLAAQGVHHDRLGLLLGLVGTDVETGTPRFTFDLPELADGLNFVALAMGVFGLGEIIRNLEHEHTRSVMVKSVSGLWLQQGGLQADHRPGAARHRPGLGSGHPAGRRGDAGLLRRLHAGKAAVAEPGPVRQGGHRGRGGARELPTMPGRRPRSSRC